MQMHQIGRNAVSDAVEMVLVVVPEAALAEDPALPARQGAEREGQQAERVIGRQDGQPDHVAEDDDEKEALERGTCVARLLDVLVQEHSVEELPNRLLPARRLHHA